MAGLSREEADEQILKRYEIIVATISKRLSLPKTEALDLAHDVIAAIYDSLDRYDPEKGPFEAWMSGVTRNFVLRYMEGRGRKVSYTSREPESTRAPLDEMVVGEVQEYLKAALERQSPIYRDTLIARFVDGKGLKDIAQSQNVPLGTVKARLARAPDLLKEGLKIQQTTMRFYLDQQDRK